MLISDRDLQKLIFSPHGIDWLTNGSVRKSAIQFLQTQRPGLDESIQAAGKREYDVFFAYDSQDRPVVAQIAQMLSAKGINVFFDVISLVPGSLWEREIESALSDCRAVAVFIGSGLGRKRGFVQKEIKIALSRAEEDPSILVIPVLLPGANIEELPNTLRQIQWVDLREEEINEDTLVPLIRALF